jgi:ubiquinone/menaquinone biosynthesis C-methylase UbiE
MIKLNLGCGQIRPTSWVNTDSSMNALIQKWAIGKWLSKRMGAVEFSTTNLEYMNLNKKWSGYKDNTIDVVYASHLFEHLLIDSTHIFLAEAFRALKPNGCIRLVMPDLYAHSKEYVNNIDAGQKDASRHLLWALNLYQVGPGEKISLLHKVLGFFQDYPHRHKYMYDKYSLTALFEQHGFKDIKLGAYGQSTYVKDINDVEGPHLYGGYPNSIYIEAIK